ncbi:forty S assembly factor, partial [Scheffersomyces stipitis CBS 6054]
MPEDSEYLRSLEIQRRHFEAQFGSIELMGFEDKVKNGADESESGSEIDSENDDNDEVDEYETFTGFDGVSSDEDSEMESDSEDSNEEMQHQPARVVPKVVKLSDDFTPTSARQVSKADKKLLKSGRAPTLAELEKKNQEIAAQNKKQTAKTAKEEDDNLENDLKLQRLLQESHILSSSLEYSGADLTMQTLDYEDPTGKARKRALDSRIRNIAAINSSTGGLPRTLEKMPMAMRKGMIRSREQKIRKYEEDARNAGIVLSKVKKGELRDLNSGKGSTSSSDRLGTGKKVAKRVRDRGLKIHGVGKSTRNGIIIPQADIDRINGAGRNKKGKKK